MVSSLVEPPAPLTLLMKKPFVIGLYGIPGSGKSHLLHQLKREPDQEQFKFYEGSEVIADLTFGGLDAFRKSTEQEKLHIRQLAIACIRQECLDSGQVAVVAGHFMFWPEEQDIGQPVYTQADLDTYTHIIYLDVPAPDIWKQRQNDHDRDRPPVSVEHLEKWQMAERTELRRLCYENGILFSVVSSAISYKVPALLREFRDHNEDANLSLAKIKLDDLLLDSNGHLQTVLVMDGDRTLSVEDTGSMFWSFHRAPGATTECPLKTLFSSAMAYTHAAFCQASLLYGELDSTKYDEICDMIAHGVAMYPEFVSLLKRVGRQEHVGAIILTCGLGRIWQKILDDAGLSDTVKVLGNGLISDGLVVTPAVKAALVAHLKKVHNVYVWAFGDSPLDLPMLEEADRPVIVVGEENTRSKTMDSALLEAINNGGLLQARQALFPSKTTPRLNTTKLPVIQLGDRDLVDSIISRRNLLPNPNPNCVHVVHATAKNAAKLLMTPTRDAKLAGPDLVDAHRRIGWYLATEYLSKLVGVEDYPIDHVQGRQTSGYRVCDEQQTLIVALMRGGEPMASGVWAVLKQATFLHAYHPEEIESRHLQQRRTVVLVDSVINNGDTTVQFVKHVRNLHTSARIIVVAGVVQKKAISEGTYARELAKYLNLSLVALRLSDNKFKGQGNTDTGNRLFNTTQFD
ncbi:uracil phosphoribosyltransferase-domain-containing protein [Biscogniauxia marginata]|nr:uracil phosphoribosyltransferase-domain-containing protein [Biscogniauxia marginata]